VSYAQRPMGDYRTYGYAGDPGWLSSLAKGLWKGVKKIAPTVIGGLIGGPAGALIGGMGGSAPSMKPSPGILQYAPPPRGQFPGGMIGGQVTMPGGLQVGAAYMPHTAIGQHAPAGYHLDKRTGTRWVRNRRMNVTNPRALRRAMRRVQGFEKLAKRTISFTKRTRLKKA